MIQLPWDNDNEHQGLIYKEEVRILLEASLKAAKVAEKIFLDGQLQIEVKSDASPVTGNL